MIYILAIFLPPVAVLMTGKPMQALINLLLCFLFWLPAVIHAFFIISQNNADKRNKELIKAIQNKK